MIDHVLNVFRPSRCERTGRLVRPGEEREPHDGCPAEGCNVLVQNGYRYAWSESNCWYERVGPAGTRTKVVGRPV